MGRPRGITMFTGKGGVGKTTCAAATALHYASWGHETLAISTDATPSLSHIFQLDGKRQPAQVAPSLTISELGEREVKEMWDRRFGREMHEVFSSFVSIGYKEFVEFMTSVLPGLADEFMVDYIRELYVRNSYGGIVWDTAPLGQTLALLQTPALLERHLRMAPRVYSRLKLGHSSGEPVLDILKRWEALSAEDMEFLRSRVEFNMVTIPEALAVAQLDDVFAGLERYRLGVRKLIINNVLREEEGEFLKTRAAQQRQYLETIHSRYADIQIIEVPMFPYEIRGIERLKEVERALFP
jgi:arsenite-transporting ATPase